jgi:hypothetical protein
MTRMPAYSSPNAVSQKEVKSPCQQQRMRYRASSKLKAVHPNPQPQSLVVALRASKRLNECFDFDSLLFYSAVVSSLVCPAGAGECAMISFLSCLFSSSGLYFFTRDSRLSVFPTDF